VISRAIVPNRGPHRSGQRSFLQIAPRRCPPYTPASPRRRVLRDRRRFVCRDSREQAADPLRHPGYQFAIFLLPHDRRGGACGGPCVPVLRALVLRFLNRLRLRQDSLPLVPPARPAETTTTAVRPLYFVLRRVNAVSPAPRYSRSSMRAQARHRGCLASIKRSQPDSSSTPHSEHVESRTIRKTTGG